MFGAGIWSLIPLLLVVGGEGAWPGQQLLRSFASGKTPESAFKVLGLVAAAAATASLLYRDGNMSLLAHPLTAVVGSSGH